jgi:hypothetical protein
MAKRSTKVLQARKEESAGASDDSLLIRSAESLGRVIGSLQRQVRGTSKNLSWAANDARDVLPELPRFDDLFGSAPAAARKRAGTRKTNSRKKKKTASKTAAARNSSKASRARNTSGTRKRAPARKARKR